MVESLEDCKNIIQLDEESEGNSIGSEDFIFRKIGSSIPLKLTDSSFDFETAPAQALAVSERHHVVFLAHSDGFYVAKTRDVMELARKIKEKGNGSGSVQESSVVDVPIGRISILALSTDSSTLAACVGADIHIFSVVSLLNKEKEPSFSCSLNESSHVKDFRWKKNLENSYIVLSSDGKLYCGDLEDPLNPVMENVDAVDWSVNGDYVAIARKNSLRIMSSDLKEQFHVFLLFQSSSNDGDCILKVDSIKWVRSDRIILGCIQLTEDGNEASYLVQVLTNNEGEITEASSKPVVISFAELFACIVDDIIPSDCGPYLFVNYLERWELVLASHRKNTDRHVVLLGWSLDDMHREVAAVDFIQDKDVPRIELPESGDDNLIVGFGVDKVSLYEKIEFQKSETEHIELYPYCVLLCLTSDGKLIMFQAARISDPPILHASGISGEDDSFAFVPLESTTKDHVKEIEVLNNNSKPTSGEALNAKRGDSILKENSSQVTESIENLKVPSISSQMFAHGTSKNLLTSDSDEKGYNLLSATAGNGKSLGTIQKSEVDAERNLSAIKQLQDNSGTKLGLPSQEGSKLEQLPVNAPLFQGVRSAFSDVAPREPGFGSLNKDLSKKEIQKLSTSPIGIGADAGFSVGSLQSDTSATVLQGLKDSVKSIEVGKGVTEIKGLNNYPNVSSGSISSGRPFQANDFTKASSFVYGGSVHGERQKNTAIMTGNATLFPPSQSSPTNFQSSSKIFSSKDSRVNRSHVVSFGKGTQTEGQSATAVGATNSDSVSSHGFSSLSREDSRLVNSYNSKGGHLPANNRSHQLPIVLESELQLSKSFCNVSEMVKELDTLLSEIEGKGGFSDACTMLQKKTVLELEDLENLSERCSVWRNTMEERLRAIQHLHNKTMQVISRKFYVEGIVKQASNSQYWELWNCQKLSPEFEVKRQKLLKLNQNLMKHIVELERHFNVLELNKFGGDKGRVFMGRKAFQNSSEPSRLTQSLHSLYNTVNSQLSAAEQQSECLSKQMAVLNIESPPVKRQNVAKELFESIGLTYDGDSFCSPNAKEADCTPDSTKKLPLASFSAIKEHPGRKAPSSLKGIEPETARRRRDSLDRSLARFEPQKTTVKRLSLEERSRVSAIDSSFALGKEAFNSRLGDGFSVLRQKDQTASQFLSSASFTNMDHQSTYPSNKEILGKPSTHTLSTHTSGSPPVSLFKWAKDGGGVFQPIPSVSPLMHDVQKVNPQPSSVSAEVSPFSTVQNRTKVNMGSAGISSKGPTSIVQSGLSTVQAVSTIETRYDVQSETPAPAQASSRISTPVVSTKPASPKKTVHIKPQTSETGTLHGLSSVPEKVHSLPVVSVSPVPSSFCMLVQTDAPTGRTHSGETSTPTSSMISSPPVSLAPSIVSSTCPSSSPISVSGESSPLAIPISTATSSSATSQSTKPFGGPLPSADAHKMAPPPSSSLPAVTPDIFSPVPLSFQTQKPQVVSLSVPTSENVVSEHPPPQPKVAVEELTSKARIAQSATPSGEISTSLSSGSQLSSHTTTSTFNFFGSALNASAALNSQPDAPSAARILFPVSSATTSQGKTEALDITVTQEDEMEEEAPITTDLCLEALGGFGHEPTPAPSAPKPNPFGGPFGAATARPASSPFSLTVPTGELFRPASFSFSSPTPSQPSQPVSQAGFPGFGTGPSVPPATGSGFGQPAQIGAGQQALGSVLGAFGQSRQLGPGLPGVGFTAASASVGFGSGTGFTTGGGLGSAGFAGAATGGGFASVTSGGASAAAAAAGGGFGGFGGAASGAAATGGFGAFGNKQTNGGFSPFGGSSTMGAGKSELFTQMRK